jgi:hypothetical protein
MAEVAAADSRAPTPAPPPYAPSWFDHLTAWVRRRPLPWWLCYLSLALLLFLLLAALQWGDPPAAPGGAFLSPALAAHLVLAGTACYVLALMHYRDDVASRALASFRGVLAADAPYAVLHYRLTTLPAGPALLLTGAGLAYGIGASIVWPYYTDPRYAPALQLATSALASALEVALALAGWAMTFLAIYHAIHQLRTVSAIYTRYGQINLFQPGPLYAFSRLTALTAVAPLPPLYAWFLAFGTASAAELTSYLLWSVFSVLGVAAFVWPLLGAHRLMAREKARLQAANRARLARMLGELDRQVETGELGGMDALKNTLDSLLLEQGVLEQISSWPWAAETVRLVGTALFLPMALFLIQQIMQRLLGL